MMYSEFIKGTGCKENEYNYQVFKNLEIMYMNSDMTKEEIYEYGKKLVDNSKSEKEIEFENKVKKIITELENRKEYLKKEIERVDFLLKFEKEEYWVLEYKELKKRANEELKMIRSKIRLCKSCL